LCVLAEALLSFAYSHLSLLMFCFWKRIEHRSLAWACNAPRHWRQPECGGYAVPYADAVKASNFNALVIVHAAGLSHAAARVYKAVPFKNSNAEPGREAYHCKLGVSERPRAPHHTQAHASTDRDNLLPCCDRPSTFTRSALMKLAPRWHRV